MLRLLYVFVAVIVARLFLLQVIQHGEYVALAEAQYGVTTELPPTRGSILVRDRAQPDTLFPLARDEDAYLLYAIPQRIDDAEAAARALEELIDLDPAVLRERLGKRTDLYEPLAHGISLELKERIADLSLPGIAFAPESVRQYPEGTVASHVVGFLGFVDNERTGQYGLEEYFEKELVGSAGFLQAERDAAGRWITVGTRKRESPRNGDDLILTIDRTVEYTVCTKLRESVERHGASSGSVILLETATGAIVAMCGYPDFDPNAYGSVENITQFTNPAVTVQYEPGSVFKPMTMAAAINEGKVTPQTQYEDKGSEEIGKYTIRNSDDKTYGVQTMTQVLEQSINTGAIFAMRQVGPETFRRYVESFGFGVKTGVELTGETSGNVEPLSRRGEIYAATASFGQGMTVSPLQLAAAYGALANRGKLMKPYLVDERVGPSGVHTKTQPTVVREVVSPETAATVTAMLVNVVQNGHGGRAGVPGYFIGGKTGTAQVPLPDRVGYDPNRTIGTFVGILPADNPRFVMVVKIDDPKDVRFAESSAAPLFGQIAKFLLDYYQIPPTKTADQ